MSYALYTILFPKDGLKPKIVVVPLLFRKYKFFFCVSLMFDSPWMQICASVPAIQHTKSYLCSLQPKLTIMHRENVHRNAY